MDEPSRITIRLKTHDYSAGGAYFVTICTGKRIPWLGAIDVGQGLCSCRLTAAGNIAESELLAPEARFDNLTVAKYCVMPNHVHAIFMLAQRREQSPRPTTLMDIVCAYKSITAKKINKMNNTAGSGLWQTRFHDHIIRSDAEYLKIWQYIDENPARWKDDCYYE